MKLNKLSDRAQKFIKNSGWMLFSRIYQMALSLIVGALTARYLGPSNYGVINYGLSYVNILNTICSLGLEGVIVKKVINEPKREGEVLGTSVALRIFSSILSLLGLSIFFSLSIPDEITKTVAIIQSISILFNVYEILELWFQAKLLSKYATIAKCIASTCVGVWKIVMLSLNVSVEFFAFTVIIESFVIMLFLIIFYKKMQGPKTKVKINLIKELVTEGMQFLLSSLCIIIYTRMDKIMLGAFIDNNSVGIYSAALTISELWQFIPMAIINSSRPLLLEYKKENEEKYNNRIKQLYSIVIAIGLIVGVGILLFGKIVIGILYGMEYIAAYLPLSILIWASTFAVLGSARTTWLITENKEKYLKIFVFLGAVVNLVLNLILIEKYQMIGVAIATLIAQFVVSIIGPFLFKETRVSTIHIFQSMNFKKYLNIRKKT